MNVKNFLVAGLAGGIVDFLLGWIFYGMLFMNMFGGPEPTHMEFIALGCLAFGFLMSYIIVRWAGLDSFTSGMRFGAGYGLIMGIMHNFFDASMVAGEVNWQKFAADIAISIIMGAIVAGVVAAINGSLSRKAAI